MKTVSGAKILRFLQICHSSMAFFRNTKGIFQESGDIFQNVAYFPIKVQNALTQLSCNTSFNIADYSTLFLPPKCMAESFSSTSFTLFSRLQLASVRAKDLYNLMNFCIHTTFFAKESILLCITSGSSDWQLLAARVTRYSNKLRTNQSVFYFTTGDQV